MDIKYIKDNQGNEFFPVVHENGVIDDNGVTLASKIGAIALIPKGDKGDPGEKGDKGDKGDPGDTAVYDPNDPSVPDFVMATTTGQSTTKAMTQKAITDELDAIKEDIADLVDESYELADSYDSSDLNTGYYAIVVGSTPSSGSGSTYSRKYIAVKKGDRFILSTYGGASARAWGFTDSDRIVQSPCAVQNLDTTSNPVLLEAPVDGYLYVNCKAENLEDFSLDVYLKKFSLYDSKIEAAKSELQQSQAVIAEGVTATQASLDKLLKKTSYTSSILVNEGYYKLGDKSVGQTAPSEFVSFANNRCAKFDVFKGDKVAIEINCTSASNARAYCLTDSNYKILVLASQNEDTVGNPVVLNVEQDGYLLLCSKASEVSSFSMTVEKYGVVSAEEVQQMLWEMDASVPKYRNNPLPIWKDTIRILAVGNSYTDDSVSYLGYIAAASGIDPSKFCIVRTWISASSLDNWYSAYVNNTTATATTRIAGTLSASSSNSGFRTLLESTEWDVITFNELSTRSCTPSLFEPALTELVKGIRKSCPNKKVVIGWNLIWRYKNGFNSLTPQGQARWEALVEIAKKKIISDNGIDFIIPSGTAIENARNSTLNNSDELTRDGTHLSDIGRYIVGCTWWEAIMAPMFNNTILGNTSDISDMPSDSRQTPEQTLTAEQKALAQRCAFNAVMDMWNLTIES